MNTFLLKRIWLFLFISLLFACSSQNSQPVALPPSTPIPTATVIPTQTEIQPTLTPLPIQSPTITLIPPYPTKHVLLDYTVSGFHTPYDDLFIFYDFTWSHLVLYTDGQMIIPGSPYEQKILSTDEINQLFAQLESLGLYTIESNQKHDPTDKLYNFGDQYSRIYDGLWSCILVNGNRSRNLCAYEPFREFLVPEMESLLQFIDKYHPAGMSQYYPDRILLWVQAGRSPYDPDLPENAIPWTEVSLPLETIDQKVIYAEGEMAKELYALYGDKGYLFNENGKEYTVNMQIVLPHEKITNRYP